MELDEFLLLAEVLALVAQGTGRGLDGGELRGSDLAFQTEEHWRRVPLDGPFARAIEPSMISEGHPGTGMAVESGDSGLRASDEFPWPMSRADSASITPCTADRRGTSAQLATETTRRVPR